MNTNIFKGEICSYCKYNANCSKDKMEYIEQDKIIYKNDFNKKIKNEYRLENKVKILQCDFYRRKHGKK